MNQDRLGLDGAFAPSKTIDGNDIQRHYHKRGLEDGYYVVVPTKAPANLNELLKEADRLKKAHLREAKKASADEPKIDKES